MPASAASRLPPEARGAPCVNVSPIPGGFITLPDKCFVAPTDPESKHRVPSLAFLIIHPGPTPFSTQQPNRPFHLMFDLGIRRAQDRYPKVLQQHLENRRPFDLSPGVAAQLRAGGLDPADIDLVLLSHVHWDHHGDPEDFPQAGFRVGHGAKAVLRHGLGVAAPHQHFEPDTLPQARTAELPDPGGGPAEGWVPLGPFAAARDFFGDGSVWVLDLPGHLPGHVGLLCRVGPERWVCLCGDAYHDCRLLTGEKEIGEWEGPDGSTLCIHLDKALAAETIGKLREFDLMTGDQCELIGAHDDVWWAKNQAKKFPNTL